MLVLALLVLAALVALGARSAWRHELWQARGAGKVLALLHGAVGRQDPGEPRERPPVELLRERDPDFDEPHFLERVRYAFLVVHEARASGDLAPARAFVSDGIHERLVCARAEEPVLGFRRELSDLVVEDATLALLRSGAVFDELTVAIRARGRLRRVRLTGAGVGPGDGVAVDAGAFWTFLRRRGAKTGSRPGLLEGCCPNCGAPIALRESADCGSCRAKLRSGEHDWVLSEITQPEAWSPRAASRIPGVSELLEADPGFSVQHLEDRAGVIFWRRLLAEREGSAARLAAVADSAFCARFDAGHAGRSAGIGHGSSGDVEIHGIGIEGVREADGWHRAVVSVRWVGQRLRAEMSGGLVPSGGPVQETTLLVLARRVGVRTDASDAISSAHCPGCGAPDTGAQGGRCAFCGSVLNDGSADWILTDAASEGSERSHEIRRKLVAVADAPALDLEALSLPDEALPWLVRMLSADGAAGSEGATALAHFARREAGQRHTLESLRDPGDVRRGLRALVDIALADGGVGEGRRAVLRELAARAGLTRLDVRMLVDRRTRERDPQLRAERRAAEERARERAHREWLEAVRRDE